MLFDSSPTESSFMLQIEDLAFAKRCNTPRNQLILAVILKFFQTEGRYPTKKDLIDPLLIAGIAHQLEVSIISSNEITTENRTTIRLRRKIRDFLGLSIAKQKDMEKFIHWLMIYTNNEPHTLPHYREKSYQFFKDNHLEPLKPTRLENLIRLTVRQFEKQFLSRISQELSAETLLQFSKLLIDNTEEKTENDAVERKEIFLRDLKLDVAGVKLKHIDDEIQKLKRIRQLNVSEKSFSASERRWIQRYYTRVMAASPSQILEWIPKVRHASMACFAFIRSQLLTDNLVDLLVKHIHNLHTSAESHVNGKIVKEVKKVNGKFDILYQLAATSLENPAEKIESAIYPKVSQETLRDLVNDLKHKGRWYQDQVNKKSLSLYSHAHRKELIALLETFQFGGTNAESELLKAIEFIKKHKDRKDIYYPEAYEVPATSIIPVKWQPMVLESMESLKDDKDPRIEINRLNYEMAILEILRDKLGCKAIWIEGAYRYRDPQEDLPSDWEMSREAYYRELNLPLNAAEFIGTLKEQLNQYLQELNDTILTNEKVTLLPKNKGHIKITPSEAQDGTTHLDALHREINRRWSTIHLINMLKEADLRIGFTQQFHSIASRTHLKGEPLQKRLLLSLYALGSNTGLKRISSANDDASHADLRYVKRRYINESNVRAAIVDIVNQIIELRDPAVWEEATTGCACDSTEVNSWDQNLMSGWHPRYKKTGIMIYWHVDTKSMVVHSQLKTCLSSEVGSMIAGVLRHDTKMNLNKTYVDTHGQSTVGYAFSYGLHFDLLARINGIHRQKLYCPDNKKDYPNLTTILKGTINWKLIEENYDDYVKHIAALKKGTVEPDVLIKKFSKENYNHPLYRALIEIGNAVKSIFLCRYLMSEELRIEIHESLNVVECLNNVMDFIFYGKLGELSTNRTQEQSLSIACLHLLQVCMVYINTLIIQEILSEPEWKGKLTPEDKRALTPLIHFHINPYGLFPLNLTERLTIEKLQQSANDDRNDTNVAKRKSEAVRKIAS